METWSRPFQRQNGILKIEASADFSTRLPALRKQQLLEANTSDIHFTVLCYSKKSVLDVQCGTILAIC